ESVRVAAREAEGRRADQERQARELRGALEGGIRSGFEPLAPALSARIEASLSGLGDALRSDREERAASLRQTAETVAPLRAAQEEWPRASAAPPEKLREQGEALRAGMEGRDAASREAWDRMAADSARGLQAALDIHAGKARDVLEALSAKWDEAVKAQAESARAVAAAAADGLGRGAGKAE